MSDYGRVEDGEVTDCLVCNVTMHLYDEDSYICPGCQHGGWAWTKAMYVRRGDTVKIGEWTVEVEAEEDFGKRCAIYGNELMWMKRKTDPVLVIKP